jgi:hypothetical protein
VADPTPAEHKPFVPESVSMTEFTWRGAGAGPGDDHVLGAISRVEAMVRWMPLGYTSAWTELNR